MQTHQPFVIEKTYNVPVEKVWKALTDKSQMKQWYFDIAEFKTEPGFEFEFDGSNGDMVYHHVCKIIEAIPNKKLKYSWKYKGYEGMSFVTFELFEENSKTRLKLTHEGLERFPKNNPAFAKRNFEEGWAYITGTALKEFIEKAEIVSA